MKKVGIIGAMELEVETLKSKMEVKSTTTKARMEFFEGTLNGVEVVIVRSGIGKVNAGMCTQILSEDALFFLVNSYTTGLQPAVLTYMIHTAVVTKFGGKVESAEIGLPVKDTGLVLPCGASGRWTKGSTKPVSFTGRPISADSTLPPNLVTTAV